MHRTTVLPLAALVTVVASVAGCGGSDDGAFETLPPIEVTTTTTTTTTTVTTDRIFYTIKPGESLAIIAESVGVTVQSIVELNGIEDPDNIQAGQIIEIPTGIQVLEELPTPTTGGG